jgi:hypothetical protein
MAITNNPFLQQASGRVGKTIVYKRYYDKTVISKVPDMSRRVLSEKQEESNERMRLATAYAKFIYKTEEGKIKARIRLKLAAHKSLFHALVKEHLDGHRQMPLDELERTFLHDMPG